MIDGWMAAKVQVGCRSSPMLASSSTPDHHALGEAGRGVAEPLAEGVAVGGLPAGLPHMWAWKTAATFS
jgi:hypothetical protein